MKKIKQIVKSILLCFAITLSIKAQTGAALNFDGVNDQVRVTTSTMGAFTIEFWMRTTQTGPTGTQWHQGYGIADADVPGIFNDYGISLLGSKVAFGTGNPDVTITSTTNVNTGNWVHVAAMFTSNPDGKMWLYVNGNLEVFLDPGVSSNARNTNANIALGSIQSNIRYFNGEIDEFRLWNRTLSICELQARMNCEMVLPQSGLLRYYQFNQGIASGNNTSITTVTNLLSGNNASINGMALTGSTSNFVAPGAVASGIACSIPSVNVQGNGNNIADGSTSPSASNFTSFSPMCTNSAPKTLTYTIQNPGTGMLTVSTPTISGPNATLFVLTSPPPSTIAAGSSATFAITFTSSTTGGKNATVTFSTNDCNHLSYSFLLGAIVNGALTITANSGTICSGNSFIITPSGASSYTFSGGTATVNPIVTTAYTITGSNSVGCTNTVVSTVSVTTTPTITINSASICLGQTYTLQPTGASSYTYIGGGPVVSPTSTSTYSVTGANGSCIATNTAMATLTVNPLPTLSLTQSSSVICVGQTATLSVTGASTYSWSSGATSSLIVVSPSTTTNYSVVGMNSEGCSATAFITENVSLCTNVNQIEADAADFSFFPNPSNGLLNIITAEDIIIEIFNTGAELVYTTILHKGTHLINMNELSSGIYLLISRSQSQIRNKKLIIN